MSSSDSRLNVNYLRKGVYHDKLTNIQLKDETEFINNYKNKNMQMSNGLNNILNDVFEFFVGFFIPVINGDSDVTEVFVFGYTHRCRFFGCRLISH